MNVKQGNAEKQVAITDHFPLVAECFKDGKILRSSSILTDFVMMALNQGSHIQRAQ